MSDLALLDHVDQVRRDVAALTRREHKALLGQFMTPSTVARFMASLFIDNGVRNVRLLDAGAGIGSLTSAFLDRWSHGGFDFSHVDVTAHEIDPRLLGHLDSTLTAYAKRLPLEWSIRTQDFIEDAVNNIQFGDDRYTHAILNPPYKKIGGHSSHRLLLRRLGIETVNLYSAFVALALSLLAPGGQLVAIVPRSFCNGPYYRPFREFLLTRAALRHLHLFAARDHAFQDDGVLQENIILLLEKGARQGDVTVSQATDSDFADLATQVFPFERIVLAGDPEQCIHIPTSGQADPLDASSTFRHSLADIGIEVSTGPVVDFRLREHLRDMPEPGAVPLLYPCHFSGGALAWPRADARKPNALMRNADTEKWLYPNGFYAVVRRFSSKEEKRRIVASVVSPLAIDAPALGFENHLNVFHRDKSGIPEDVAHGLAAYLNSTAVDRHFRRFSGHTQVNVADLRRMKFPARDALSALGRWAMKTGAPTQEEIDREVESNGTRFLGPYNRQD
ncbi:MAG: Eco57I restriction-modification methylase domain-containing protein [Sulfurisoma sp.]|nr:Eco57I restriction-modification methylase domain-containing protein [Sulfurisoma sp.]